MRRLPSTVTRKMPPVPNGAKDQAVPRRTPGDQAGGGIDMRKYLARPAQGVTEVYGGMDEVLEIRKRKQEEARRAKSSTFWGSWDSDSTTEGEGEEVTRKKKKKFKDLVELGVDSDSE